MSSFVSSASRALAANIDDVLSSTIAENQERLIRQLTVQQEAVLLEAENEVPEDLLSVSEGFRSLFRAQQHFLLFRERLHRFVLAVEDESVPREVLDNFLGLATEWDSAEDDPITFFWEKLHPFLRSPAVSPLLVLNLPLGDTTEEPKSGGGLEDVDTAAPPEADFIRKDAVPDDEDFSAQRWEKEDSD